jgi:hypothetical protein
VPQEGGLNGLEDVWRPWASRPHETGLCGPRTKEALRTLVLGAFLVDISSKGDKEDRVLQEK